MFVSLDASDIKAKRQNKNVSFQYGPALVPVSLHSQWDVIGDTLGLDEVLGLVLGHHVPADAAVDAVLQQHGPVHGVRAVQRYVAAVGLRGAADLQHKHDLTVETERGEDVRHSSGEVQAVGCAEAGVTTSYNELQ